MSRGAGPGQLEGRRGRVPTPSASKPGPLEYAAGNQPPESGWHPVEWACELAGTALLILGGLSAVCLDFGPHSPVTSAVPSHYWRLLITGLLFATSGSLVTISPLGRRSGAHLNPAVTLAFWFRHHVHPHDLAGYIVSQCLGALLGAAVVELLWGSTATSASVSLAVTQPGRGFTAGEAAALEALLAVGIYGLVPSTQTLTAKLFHDSRYPSTLGSRLVTA